MHRRNMEFRGQQRADKERRGIDGYKMLSGNYQNAMSELKPRIHDEVNDLDYIPIIELPEDDDHPIGKLGRMHRAYLEETNPILLNHLILTGRLHTYLANFNKQSQDRWRLIIRQMAKAEGVNNDFKRHS